MTVAENQHTIEHNADEGDKNAEFGPTKIDSWIGKM